MGRRMRKSPIKPPRRGGGGIKEVGGERVSVGGRRRAEETLPKRSESGGLLRGLGIRGAWLELREPSRGW